MPNTRYLKGANYERAKVKELNETPGHIAIRSAGSHKIFDFVDFDFDKNDITLYQAKRVGKYVQIDKEVEIIRKKLKEKRIDITCNIFNVRMVLLTKKDHEIEVTTTI